jgi:uncharacterized membrane protein YkvA (DUF1232 family)
MKMNLKRLKKKKKSKGTLIKFVRKNWALILAITYFFFPLDFIPDIIPGFGWGDDVLVLLAMLFIRYRKFSRGKANVIEGELVDG